MRVLVLPSGLAVTLEHFVREYDVQGSGVEDDPTVLEHAEARLRASGMFERVHIQLGAMDGLPYRDAIFDVVIAELGVTARVSAKDAVREIVRVAKPGACVVLVQPVWKVPVDSLRRDIHSRLLGCRPITMVEWKRILRDAGVEGLHTGIGPMQKPLFGREYRTRFPTSLGCSRLPRSWGSCAGPDDAGAGPASEPPWPGRGRRTGF